MILKLKGGHFSFTFFLILLSFCSLAQNKIEEAIDEFYDENVATSMDTSYINFQVKNWSLRALSTFKDHSFQLRNSGNKLSYTPNNRFGVGFGAAYFPILVDIGFNIKREEKERTQRFDIQADLILKSTFLGLVVQDYQGFNMTGNNSEKSIFRHDIQSTAIQLSYAHAFNSNKISGGSILSGAHKQKKNVGTFLLGGFLSYYQLEADSSIIPSDAEVWFDNSGDLQNMHSYGGGVIGGYGHIFVLQKDFFLFINGLGGLGLARKELDDGLEQHVVSDPFIYRLNLRISFGYNGPRLYVILTGTDDLSITSLDYGNWGLLNAGKAKMILGYKFRKRK